MGTQIIADVYVDGGRNIQVHTTPGRIVKFTGGHAYVVDHRDMPHLLQMDGAKVHPRPEVMPWATQWLAATREIKAEVHWPEGWEIQHTNQDEFTVNQDGPPVLPESKPAKGKKTAPITEKTAQWVPPAKLTVDDLLGSGTP